MKSFKNQVLECDFSGNRFAESCFECGQVLLMCKKYGGQCKSNKCRWQRMTIREKIAAKSKIYKNPELEFGI